MDEALLAKISGKMSPKARESFTAFLNKVEEGSAEKQDDDDYEITDVDGVAALLPSDVLQMQRDKFLRLQAEMKGKKVFAVKAETPPLIVDGVDINAKGQFGHTALIRAVLDEDEAEVAALLLKGADKTIQDNSHQTAFDKARGRGYYRIMALLDPTFVVPVMAEE